MLSRNAFFQGIPAFLDSQYYVFITSTSGCAQAYQLPRSLQRNYKQIYFL